MGHEDDHGLGGAVWVPVGEAARRASVDPRTIRRWADSGRIVARVTPGGHRQIKLASLIDEYTAATDAKQNRAHQGRYEGQPPEVVIPQLCEDTITWATWQPGRTHSDDRLASLREDIRALTRTLGDLEEVITDELAVRDRDATT